MKNIGLIALGLLSWNMAGAQQSSYTYKVPEIPWGEGFGNHRAVVEVENSAQVVSLDMEWRRPDLYPENKRFLVINAETGDTVRNVKKVYVDNEQCSIAFGPVDAGTYYFYYLPYTVQNGGGFYYGDYLADKTDVDASWETAFRSKDKVEQAVVKTIEARTDFDSFYPMEVIATQAEVARYCKENADDWSLFPEDRSNPIRMRDYLPVKWMSYQQGQQFTGQAAPNEYYAFQIGVWSPSITLKNVKYEASDLRNGTSVIPASSITCFNTEGVDPKGNFFKKIVNVAAGKVQPLWFGVDIPREVKAGLYTGKVTITCADGRSKELPVELEIKGTALADRGDGEPWRHSRLRWLNSTLGEEDVPVGPYTDLRITDNRIFCLGRDVVVNEQTGLPLQINSWGTDILASSINFIIETETGVKKFDAQPTVADQKRSSITGKWSAKDNDLAISCEGIMESDGWMNYVYTITPFKDIRIKDVRLEIPVRNEVASYFLGAGLPGQDTPAVYEGKWDTPETTVNNFGVSIPVSTSSNWLWPFDSFWIGNAHAGVHCELRGSTYSGPLLNSYRPAYPDSWNNKGKGGFRIKKGDGRTLVTVYSGERMLSKNVPLKYDFALLITPVKELNIKSQFTDRYYHNGAAPVPTDADVKAGVKIINIHHGNAYHPYINYPFLTSGKLKNFVDKWHKKGCKVKLYYTLRELTNVVTELWAIRSLDTEILRGGNGGGYPWCREHLISDYTPQWYQHFDEGEVPIGADAAILTSESDSRWYNYYVEGLKWMVQNLDIDGIYMDDVSFGRDILKRMRRAMDSVKPGCIIDLHSNTGFSKGPANQYAEFFPYIDKLWFGESFLYDKMTPANWLVESSGIPFGLMGDMLYRGGNKWLGMQYGMTVRHPWFTEGVICDPRVVWKIWDDFGIADAEMIGFWEADSPVKASDDDVKVTAYKKSGKVLLSIGNYSDELKKIRLSVDWKALGFKTPVKLIIPDIPDFQKAKSCTLQDEIEIEPRKGLLVYLKR